MGGFERDTEDGHAEVVAEAVAEEESRRSSSWRTLEIAVDKRGSEPGAWTLDVQDEKGTRRIVLEKERVVVGTAPEAHVVIHDRTVSSLHCALSIWGAGIKVEDMDSRNGTFVNDARVREAWVREGTTLTIGHSTLVVAPRGAGREVIPPSEPLAGIVGNAMAMRQLATQVRRLSQGTAPVLIRGETGTGKELVARALHNEGPRSGKPFVVVNVNTLPRELIESELFGHERGAFTGAVNRRLGVFAEADGGTLFLDEIGDLPLDAQPKLLRALDGYEVRRVGATGSGARANARIVAATHVDLEAQVKNGVFRRDLFHRLEVFVLRMPPLKDRLGDLPALAKKLLVDVSREVGGERKFAPGAIARLAKHSWPGNVRELRNALLRAAFVANGALVDVEAVEYGLANSMSDIAPRELTPAEAKEIFRTHGNNLSAAARAANYPRTSFRKLLR